MASNDQSQHSRKKDKAKPKEASFFKKYVQAPLSTIRSRFSSSARFESGFDDVDRPLNNEGNGTSVHGSNDVDTPLNNEGNGTAVHGSNDVDTPLNNEGNGTSVHGSNYVDTPLNNEGNGTSVHGSDDADTPLNNEGRRNPMHGWMQSSIFCEPKPLIQTDVDGHFALCDETIMQISAITWKLVIVGIAGPYRCGKSFLMNRLVGKSKGFFVGNSTDAATKGIWAWCQKHPEQEETVLLLLDTEGLGDIRKGDNDHDNKILTLITLMSNVLVFNMMGRFDQDTISKMSFATQISNSVRFGSDPNKKVLPTVMPELILCLRDFFLRLGDGIESTDMYFEDCLKDVEGKVKYNAPRQSLKTFFQIRHCFTFPVPADEKTMYCLENAKKEDLKESFLQKADEFSQHIFKCEPKKMYDSDFSVNAIIDGSIFKGLLEYHVDCTNKGVIPDIEDAFFTAARKENEKVMKEVKDKFMTTINRIKLPVDSLDEFQKEVITTLIECVDMFRERTKMDKVNKQEIRLQDELQKKWNDLKKENSKLLQKQFVENLMKKYSSIFEKTRSAHLKENGYQEYKEELKQMKMAFENGLDKSLLEEFSLAWAVFRNRIRKDKMRILKEEKKLTEAQIERQNKKLKEQHDKALKELAEQNKKMLEYEVKRLQIELQEQRDKKHEQQLKEIIEELKKFKGLGVWERLKFVITGTIDD